MSYTFPRVNTTIVAKTRKVPKYVENPKIPVLFATIVADKGPFALTKVRSLTEFREIYGELSFEKQGQDVLNLYQWIGSAPYNGYAWIKRVDPAFVKIVNGADTYKEDSEVLAVAKGVLTSSYISARTFTFTSKLPGDLFTHYKIKLIQRKNAMGSFLPIFNILVLNEKNRIVSELKGIENSNIDTMLPQLEFFSATISSLPTETDTKSIFGDQTISWEVPLSLDLSGTKVASGLTDELKPDDVFKAINLYYKTAGREELEDMLSYPISMILDGNYPIYLKNGIIDFINDVRDDVHFMLSRATYKIETVNSKVAYPLVLDEMDSTEVSSLLLYNLPEQGNVSIWAPDISRVENPAIEVKGYVNVSSIYELASKIPYNDYNYGIWWNFVGPRRGVTNNELLHTNTSREKQDYVDDKTNYIEKTNRDQCFMLQRTTGKDQTAYVQLHASRLTQYLRREITWIGRRYLFEYNDIDSTTYSECKSEIKNFLNKFASIAIDMSEPYELDILKTSETKFTIKLTKLKYKDIVEAVDLYIELE